MTQLSAVTAVLTGSLKGPQPHICHPRQECPPSSSSLPRSTALCPTVLSEPFQQVWPQNTSLLVARKPGPGLSCGGDEDVAGQLASASKSTIPEQTQPALNPSLLPHPLRAAPSPHAVPTTRPSVAHSVPISSVISTSSACLPLNGSPGKGFEEVSMTSGPRAGASSCRPRGQAASPLSVSLHPQVAPAFTDVAFPAQGSGAN